MPENNMSDLTNGATHYNKNTLCFYKYSANKDKMYYLDGNMWIELNHWPPSNAVKKIPVNGEQWTVYNNTLPLCELTDEQAAMLFNAWRSGADMQFKGHESECWQEKNANRNLINKISCYRVKQKSEREMFIDKSIKLVKPETYNSMEKMFGAQFDAGARYIDNTQYFGENI